MDIKRNVLLNPGPATTTDSVKTAQVVPDICPREKEFGDMLVAMQEDLTDFAGSRKNNVCVLVGGSGTAAVEMVVCSVIPTDSAIFVINNGAYGARIVEMAKIHHIPVVEYQSPHNEEINYDDLKEQLFQAKHTLLEEGIQLSHLAMIHHETTSGLLNDTHQIGSICQEHDMIMILDAMSSYGGMPIDMDGDGIHFLISSSNKNIQGMAGIGIIIANKKTLEETKKIPKRSLYLNLYDQYSYFEKSKQFRFTPPVQTVYALQKAIEETKQETIAARFQRYQDSYRTLRSGMEDIGFRVLVDDEYSSGFITTFFDPEDGHYSFEDMHDFFYEKGFTIYPGKVSLGGTFRVANIGAIDTHDITDFLTLMNTYLEDNHITCFE